MISGKISRGRRPDESQEEYWRKERYSFLEKFSDEPILMAHHLNDVIETWTMTAFRGEPKIIPLQNKRYNILRPMLCVPKRDIEDWSRRHDVKHVFDRSNNDTSIRRNYIRHVMMKDIYHISPGIETVLKKKIEAEYKKIAETYKMEVEAVKGLIKAEDIKKDLAVNKAIDLIKTTAKITEKAE